jgi:hypothetical protein
MNSRANTMRTSDAERHKVADFLRDACGEGRLSTDELEERLDALYRGGTVADIAALVGDLPGGGAVIPRLNRAAVPRRVAAPVPARRRRRSMSPAVPLGAMLVALGVTWLAVAALPPLIAVVMGALLVSLAIVVGVFAVVLAPVGIALFAIAWLVQRVFRGAGHPPPWVGYGPRMRRGRHPFL